MSVIKKSYPEQTGTYKVIVKNGGNWKDFNTCRFSISVGQSKHEKDKFDNTLNWAEKRFDKMTILVNDSLQRWNIMHNISEDMAYKQSKQAGDEWIKRNLRDKDLPQDKVRVIRWDEWLENPKYKEKLALVNDLYKNNATFKAEIEAEINRFQERNNYNFNPDLCRKYLLEETAVFQIIFEEEEEAADVYPGSTLLPVTIAYEGKIKELTPSKKITFTRISLERNKKHNNY